MVTEFNSRYKQSTRTIEKDHYPPQTATKTDRKRLKFAFNKYLKDSKDAEDILSKNYLSVDNQEGSEVELGSTTFLNSPNILKEEDQLGIL